MPEQTIAAAPTRGLSHAEGGRPRRRLAAPPKHLQHPWVLTAAALIAVSIAIVVVAGIRPNYDPYGWLVWGRQTLHWNLSTNGEPSWKPLTFLFTFPYALAGRAQLWLWMVTAVALSLSGVVFAARIAEKLTRVPGDRRYAPTAAAVFAGVGLLGIQGYADFILTGRSDPIIVALCLAAIDSHLSKRPRTAFALLALAALGRPEAWPFAGLYALWAWRAIPSMRALLAAGVAIIPAAWFLIPGLTSKSWFISGDLALHTAPQRHGNQIIGVIDRFLDLQAWPIELAAGLAIVLAARRRDGRVLMLAGAAALWLLVEVAFALHGWSGASRYMLEPAAVVVVLAGSAVGWVLAATARRPGGLAWCGPVAVLALVAILIPTAARRVKTERADLVYERRIARQIDRLTAVITRQRGARILACGQPVTVVGFQSALAWEMGVNVDRVGFAPGQAIRSGDPIVLFEPHLLGWNVRAIHPRPADRAACSRLATNTPFG